VSATGGNERALIQGRYSIFSPSFWFDGSQIVFCDYDYITNLQQIIVYSLKTGSITTLTQPGRYYHTDWSP
jgi:Tol biopolymer transport system component